MEHADWVVQLLDQIKMLDPGYGDAPADDVPSFASALMFAENEQFEEHLRARSDDIKGAISVLFGKAASAIPEVNELRKRISGLLAAEKVHSVELQKALSEKEQLSERLDAATYRYIRAEKNLDRAKSQPVQQVERQAILGGTSETGSGLGGGSAAAVNKDETSETNGDSKFEGSDEESQIARKQALAASEKRKEQLEKLEAENQKLSIELTTMTAKFACLSDDDYAKSELFKHMKSQQEDVIKRINNLEAVNTQLREEAQKLQAERTAYRVQVDDELRASTVEVESQFARAESDLARIRNSRDELVADMSIRKANADQKRTAIEQMQELVNVREARIAALESEVERLRSQLGECNDTASSSMDDENVSPDELRSRLKRLEKEHALLSQELPGMEQAYKRANALAGKKVAETAAFEENISRLSQEKAKADQKYFGAMKAKEAREAEIRVLRAQNKKSSEIVSQLKDAESTSRTLIVNLEKQLAEVREALHNVTLQYRNLQQKEADKTAAAEAHALQVIELKKTLAVKDASTAAAAQAQRQAEVELEEVKVRLEESTKNLEASKKTKLTSSGTENEGWKVSQVSRTPGTISHAMYNKQKHLTDEWLRTQILAQCNVCNFYPKNTVLKTCGHVFCNNCVDGRIQRRERRCPHCNKSFGNGDHMRVTL